MEYILTLLTAPWRPVPETDWFLQVALSLLCYPNAVVAYHIKSPMGCTGQYGLCLES
jgi:hypothetical protein